VRINPYNSLQNEYRNYHITAGRNARGQSTNDGCTSTTIIIILIFTVFVVAISVPIDVLGRSRRYWAGTHWEGLTVNGGCSAFRARKYTAELLNIPFGDNPVTACGQSELFIHGRTLLPTYCTIGVRRSYSIASNLIPCSSLGHRQQGLGHMDRGWRAFLWDLVGWGQRHGLAI